MTSIIYKGKDYANNIIKKGVLYTSENNEFVLNRENLEQIELHAGSQKIYGNIGGDFVAKGYYIYNKPVLDLFENDLITKENLYSNVYYEDKTFLNVSVIGTTATTISIKCTWSSTGIGSSSTELNPLAIVKTNESNYYTKDTRYYQNYIKIEKINNPKYIGCFLLNNGISGTTYLIRPILVVFNEENKLIPFKFAEHSNFSEDEKVYGAILRKDNDFQFTMTNIEKQFYQGLTEIKTHISSSQYAKNADGAINAYYDPNESSNLKFYQDYDISASTYSNQIVSPIIDRFYLDILTNKIYNWNGTAYEMLIE